MTKAVPISTMLSLLNRTYEILDGKTGLTWIAGNPSTYPDGNVKNVCLVVAIRTACQERDDLDVWDPLDRTYWKIRNLIAQEAGITDLYLTTWNDSNSHAEVLQLITNTRERLSHTEKIQQKVIA
jgi:hypothetical protein